MRLPKTVNICGKNYSVHKNTNKWGGDANTPRQEIFVGTKKNQSEHRKFENYLHEVMEIIACERNIRYEGTINDDEKRFVMNHQEFDNFVGDISAAIFPMIKD